MNRLTILAIMLLAIEQILINIKINSYQKEQMKVNQYFYNHITNECEVNDENRK